MKAHRAISSLAARARKTPRSGVGVCFSTRTGRVTGLKPPPPTTPTPLETLHGASSLLHLGPSAIPAAQAPPSVWITGSHRGSRLSPSPHSGPRSSVTSSEEPAPTLAGTTPSSSTPTLVCAWPGEGGSWREGGALHISYACSHFPPRQGPGHPLGLWWGVAGGTSPLLCSLLWCHADACYK